ncbi:MAG: hypothetical protein PHO89_08435, partial [Methylacidiphilaceae bacterium]|nr:hypothetical protein [Candidatus Methylacidiphilaceae bacterium]
MTSRPFFCFAIAASALCLPTIASAAAILNGVGGIAAQGYAPGLGEIMSAIQLRHAKLWFAGKAKNWALAAYELDEIQEGFDEAVRLHPEHNGRPIAERIGPMTAQAMEHLRKA